MRSIVTGGAGPGPKPCGNVGTAPRRRDHRQPRDRAPGEHWAPPRRVTFSEGSITDLDLLREAFPGAAGIFGGHRCPGRWRIPSPPRLPSSRLIARLWL